MKKFSLYVPQHLAETLAACATANGMSPAALIRAILIRGVDLPITIDAPRTVHQPK